MCYIFRIVFVYRFGGIIFDVIVLVVSGGMYRVVVIEYDIILGGIKFDELLF